MSKDDDIARAIEKVRDRIHTGRPDPQFNGPVDSYDIREATRDALKGQVERKPEIWKQVMEAHGFVWYEPKQLDRLVGPESYIPSHLEGVLGPDGRPLGNASLYQYRPHRDGQWRRPRQAYEQVALSYTVTDLFAYFGAPEAFDRWIRSYEMKLRARRAGLILPG